MIDVSELNLKDTHDYLKEIIDGNKEIKNLVENTSKELTDLITYLKSHKIDEFDRIYCTKLTKENVL